MLRQSSDVTKSIIFASLPSVRFLLFGLLIFSPQNFVNAKGLGASSNSYHPIKEQRRFIIHIINLDKDKKRWERVTSRLQQQHDNEKMTSSCQSYYHGRKKIPSSKTTTNNVVEIYRLPATYGKNLTTQQLKENTTFVARHFLTKGTIGCYLSHRTFWEHVIINSNDNDDVNNTEQCYHICFEDDVILADNIGDLDTLVQRLNDILDELEEEEKESGSTISSSSLSSSCDWDVIFLGALGSVHPKGKYGWNRIASFFAGGGRKPKQVTSNVYIPRRPLGAHAYMLSNQGAQKLLSKAWKVSGHVDVVAWKLPELKVYCIHPMLIYQGMEEQSTIGAVTHGVETKLPKLILDEYTKIRFEWVFNAPVLRFGSFILTMGRSVSYIVGGYLMAWVLRDKFPWLLPIHSIIFATLFVLTKLTTIPCGRR